MSEIVTIRSCASREEAELLKSLLEAAGIQAMVAADDYVGLPLMVSGGVKLQVLREHAERADQVLDAADEQIVPDGMAEGEFEGELHDEVDDED